jgi:hypothetical protein
MDGLRESSAPRSIDRARPWGRIVHRWVPGIRRPSDLPEIIPHPSRGGGSRGSHHLVVGRPIISIRSGAAFREMMESAR